MSLNEITQINSINHTKLITQIENTSLQNPDYLKYKIEGISTQATIKTHIIIYGVRGWVDSVNSISAVDLLENKAIWLNRVKRTHSKFFKC